MSKNIETCKSEEVLSSVLDQQPQDYPSVQQAVHDLGVTALPAASAADPDIVELPSNVEVFVRRVLKAVVYDRVLPVVQQMWQAVLNRCSDYLPDTLLPYAQDPSLRTLGTLPTALSALAPRKISNGGATNDGIKDGVSLARLLGGDYSDVTKVVDDTPGWTAPIDAGTRIKTAFPNCKDFTLGCRVALGRLFSANDMTALTLTDLQVQNDGYLLDGNFTGLEEVTIPVVQIKSTSNWTQALLRNNSTTKILRCPNLKYMTNNIGQAGLDSSKILVYDCSGIEEIYAENLEEFCSNPNGAGGIASGAANLKKVVVGNIRIWHCQYAGPYFFDNYRNTSYDNLIDLEFKSLSCSLNLKNWTAANVLSGDNLTTFLQNFLHHIAERLAVGPTTNRLTLTLSADVYSACGFGATIDDTTDIRYLIKKAIQDRNWKVTDGTNNFNQ